MNITFFIYLFLKVIRGQYAECKKQIKAAMFAEAMKDERTASASDQIDISL